MAISVTTTWIDERETHSIHEQRHFSINKLDDFAIQHAERT